MIVRRASTLLMQSEAWFSDCGQFRYLLRRAWDNGPAWLAIFCNPSDADELRSDPTVTRTMARAVSAGAGSLTVCNAQALISTQQAALMTAPDPTGPENDAVIRAEIERASLVLCGWGNHKGVRARGRVVLEMIRNAGKVAHALRINGDGSPAHPLYLPYSLIPQPMRVPEMTA